MSITVTAEVAGSSPSSPPYVSKDLGDVWTYSDNEIWAQSCHGLNFTCHQDGRRALIVGCRCWLSRPWISVSGDACADESTMRYPRVVFAVAVSLSRVVDLRRSLRLKSAASLRQSCLALDDLSVSMEVGSVLAMRRVQGLLRMWNAR
jgi:hypothetical protein